MKNMLQEAIVDWPPSVECLRELLDYNPDTGLLFWKKRERKWFVCDRICNSWNSQFAGKQAITTLSKGYLTGRLFYKAVKAHRLAWAIHHGRWPFGDVDHINLDGSDNRIANLREASRSQNASNCRVRSTSISGLKGVYKYPNGRWRSVIRVGGKMRHLGFFDTPEDAHQAYCKAAVEVHGEYARTQ